MRHGIRRPLRRDHDAAAGSVPGAGRERLAGADRTGRIWRRRRHARTDLALLLEEAGNHFEELGLWLFRNFTYGCYAVLKHGTQEQKQRIVPGVVKGEISVAFALTEPDSGSDAAA